MALGPMCATKTASWRAPEAPRIVVRPWRAAPCSSKPCSLAVTTRRLRPRQEIERRACDVLPGRDASAVLVEIGEELLKERLRLRRGYRRPCATGRARHWPRLAVARGFPWWRRNVRGPAPRTRALWPPRPRPNSPPRARRRDEASSASSLMVRGAFQNDNQLSDADDRREPPSPRSTRPPSSTTPCSICSSRKPAMRRAGPRRVAGDRPLSVR